MTSVAYELKNAYIGGDAGWQPGANTLLYMPLDVDLRDLSSYNRTASITNGTISYSTIGGVKCAYPTSTGRINIPMTDFNNTAYTENLWVYATGNTYWKFLIGNKSSSSYVDCTFVTNDSNGDKLAHYWGGDHFSNTVYTTGEWKLITVTKSGNTVKMYQDGVQFYTYSYSGSSYTFSSIDLFSRSDYGQQRPGYAADFVVEKVCWTDEEVLNYYNSTKSKYAGWLPGESTVAYYPLTANFNDQSGNGYNLTTSNASISTAGGVACAYFNTGKAYNATPSVGTQRTLSAWVYNIYTSGDRIIIGTGASTTDYNGMYLAVSGGKAQISDFQAVGIASISLTQNVWHNLVAVNDNTSMKIYVDGVLQASGTHNHTNASTGIGVGGRSFSSSYDSSNNCIGYISEAIIESAVWTDQEVANYYNTTKSKYGI